MPRWRRRARRYRAPERPRQFSRRLREEAARVLREALAGERAARVLGAKYDPVESVQAQLRLLGLPEAPPALIRESLDEAREAERQRRAALGLE